MRLLLLALTIPACVGGKPADDGGDAEDTADSGAPAATCPVALVSPASLAWSDLVVGEPATLGLSVVNNCVGEGALSVVAEAEAGGPFTVAGSPVSLAPGEVATLEVTLLASDYDDVVGTLLLTTNDPAAGTIAVPLSGAVDADLDDDGYDTVDAGGEDCDDADADVHPTAAEVYYDGVDQDCDGASDHDADRDGYDATAHGGGDCDDEDPEVHPDAAEIWYDGQDRDCDGASDYDADADGFDSLLYGGGTDCDDAVATTFPGAEETWYDGIDADCDGASDYDADADGFDATAYGGADCDDTLATTNPVAEDAWYDGVDADCDGASDFDADADGFDATAYGGDDCDDALASTHPAAAETWYDGVDANCDGASDYDTDGDGFDAAAYGGADCDDLAASVNPDASDAWYDGLDQDCDGASDYDADGDGFDADTYGGADCDDVLPAVHPGAPDVWYDGVDADCDAASDYDADADGHDSDAWGGDDCDDADATVSPDGTEAWYDGVDADCDGASDYDADGDGVDAFPWGDDCDDDDAARTEGVAETRNGLDDDCDGAVDEGLADMGDIVVSEVMANPNAVSDTVGEWFEVYNASDYDIDMSGWIVYSDDGGYFVVGSSLVVPAGGYAVLGVEDDPALNGGVTVDYVYSRPSFGLGDAGDSIFLVSGSTTIAEVSWTSTWPVTAGAAMALDDDHLVPGDSTLVANWCAADEAWASGDLGSPGVANGNCSALDDDGDGSTTSDCDDDDPSIEPGATEVADGVDQNCNGFVDEAHVPLRGSRWVSGDADYDYLSLLGVEDYDGDGASEVVLFDQNGQNVYFLDGEDYGTWAGPVSLYDDASFSASSSAGTYRGGVVSTGDVTGDGVEDLLYPSMTASFRPGFVLFEGPITGATTGKTPTAIFSNYETYSSEQLDASHDFDGDGIDDVVYSNSVSDVGSGYGYTGSIAVIEGGTLSGTPDWGDAAVRLYGNDGTDHRCGAGLKAGDFDGDGHADLAVSCYGYPYGVYVWLGDGLATTGTLSLPSVASVQVESYAMYVIEAHDADDDGADDLVMDNYGSGVRWFLGIGGMSGVVTTTDAWVTDGYLTRARYDGDGDGHEELGIYRWSSGNANVLGFYPPAAFEDGVLGDGEATWGATVVGYPVAATSADLDDDGDTEVIPWATGWYTATYETKGGLQVIEP